MGNPVIDGSRTRRILAAWSVLPVLLVTGCAGDDRAAPAIQWTSPLYADHPLAGRIWKPSDQRHATAGELYAALKTADFVLIGEKHDNADHHRLQAALVGNLAANGRRPALVFEMLADDQQQALDAHLAENPDDAAGIGAAVGWDKSGWPDWAMYRPIAEQALDNEMPLLAGGIRRDILMRIAREGPDALGEGRATAMMLDRPIGEDKRTEIRQVIFDSHCQQLPETMLDPMVAVTLAKDAVMADRMIAARERRDRDVSVLIAGAGHVRADWAVPLHLKRREAGARVVTVGFAEVNGGILEPAAHAVRYGGRMPFDFVWFTPRVDDNDPCEEFAEQLKQMRERRGKPEEGESD